MPQNPVFSFTSRYNNLSKVLINQIVIFQAYDPSNKEGPPPHKVYDALWDTGATNTVISKKVVDECGLKPIGMAQVHTTNNIRLSKTYLISIGLPNKIKIPTLKVTDGDLGPKIDVLIGMDIIGLGDFAVTNKDGKTVFSFRLPSIECIDFVMQKGKGPPSIIRTAKVGRNEPCTCGSGKKYKKCCGR